MQLEEHDTKRISVDRIKAFVHRSRSNASTGPDVPRLGVGFFAEVSGQGAVHGSTLDVKTQNTLKKIDGFDVVLDGRLFPCLDCWAQEALNRGLASSRSGSGSTPILPYSGSMRPGEKTFQGSFLPWECEPRFDNLAGCLCNGTLKLALAL